MVKRMTFSIDESGEVTINVEGAEGSECEKMTGPFEDALGKVAVRKHKDSYFSETASELNQELNGDSHR
jgi:hypothetical protein